MDRRFGFWIPVLPDRVMRPGQMRKLGEFPVRFSGLTGSEISCEAVRRRNVHRVHPSAHPILLIVEDDERLRCLVESAAARSAQYAMIHSVGDGQAALEHIRWQIHHHPERVPDYILSDLSMPRLDGLGLLRELKRHEKTRRIPVAIMTSSNLPNDREDAMNAGCCAFFHKPQRFEVMCEIVGSLPRICEMGAMMVEDSHPAQ